MKKYRVFVTDDAKHDLRKYIRYLKEVKKSPQAAKNVMADYTTTRKSLETLAGSIKEPESIELIKRELKRINFKKHNYFLLFRIEDDKAYVTNMFHGLEDYENKLQ